MKGIHNRILKVDLTRKTSEIEVLPPHVYRACLGGKGLATYLLLNLNPPSVDPLSPENNIVFATGPVTGSRLWGSCRYGVYTKSPQTAFYSESYAGGKAPEAMDSAGFDAIVIGGRCDRPSVLVIDPNGANFHDAADIWGRETYETEDILFERFGHSAKGYSRGGAVVIGPASENLVSFGVIENDYWRSAGRTGAGTVMGAKKLKGIFFQGNRRRPVADLGMVHDFALEISKTGKDNPGAKAYKSMGTPMLVDIMNEAGGFPTRYWQKGQSGHRERINASALAERCDVTPHACLKCFMACGRLSVVKEGRFKGLKIEGPEYETIYSFGGLCEIGSIEEIVYLNDICDRLGMDTITAGNLCGLAIEAARQGRIKLRIDYGDVDAVAELLHDIAYGRSYGIVLAKGIKHAAREWEMEDQAIHVKGLEPAGYDPRILKGMGLAYGTSDRGACHLRATFYKPELSNMIPRDQIEGKAAMFAAWEDRLTIFDTLVLCRFYRDMYQWEEITTMLKATTGLELDIEQMRGIASAVTDNTRRFNIREGLTARDDSLPKRFLTEALPETNRVITEEEMSRLLSDYYEARGWDEKGIPPSTAQSSSLS